MQIADVYANEYLIAGLYIDCSYYVNWSVLFRTIICEI